MWVLPTCLFQLYIQGLGQCPLDVFVDPVPTLWARSGPGFIYYLTPMHAPCLTEGPDNTLSLLHLVVNNLWNVWVFPFPWYTATWINGHWGVVWEIHDYMFALVLQNLFFQDLASPSIHSSKCKIDSVPETGQGIVAFIGATVFGFWASLISFDGTSWGVFGKFLAAWTKQWPPL